VLIAYSYPDGTPAVTVVGLVVLALTLLAYWSSLRLLSRGGLATRRALAVWTLTVLAGVCAEGALLFAPLVSDGVALAGGALRLAFVSLLTAVLV
jgi:hypothetical protein